MNDVEAGLARIKQAQTIKDERAFLDAAAIAAMQAIIAVNEKDINSKEAQRHIAFMATHMAKEMLHARTNDA